jgi:hypothetical protein
MPPDLLNAILIVGLPVMAITFVLFAWAYYTGKVIPADDVLEDTEQQIDEMMDDLPEHKKSGNFIMDKWFEFGGGYFGLMMLITFLHLEFMEILDLGSQLAGIDSVSSLVNSLIQISIQLMIESFMNFINAFMWWNHWSRELPIAEGSGVLWLGVSYVGYVFGEWLAGFFKGKQISE